MISGCGPDQVRDLLAKESASRARLPAARSAAGAAFGGSWFDHGTLVVAVTDAGRASAVRAAGATPAVVANTEKSLDTTMSTLDRMAGTHAPAGIAGWHVDVRSNSVVLTVVRGATDIESFVDKAKAAGPVRVEQTTSKPRTLSGTVVGGDAYFINEQFRCSVGFLVNGGFVSAGHCGSQGDTVTGADDSPMGTFQGSSFPGNDYSFVATNSSWSPSPVVNGYGYGNGDVTVTGSTAAGVGQSVCHSGSTSGWHCGTIEATNQTVNYAEGTVFGLTQTNACAEPGDSGGTTFFQPVNEILSAFGLTLVTG